MSIQINRVIDFAQDKVTTLMSLPCARIIKKSFFDENHYDATNSTTVPDDNDNEC